MHLIVCSTCGLCITLLVIEILGFWMESGGSNNVYYFGLSADMAGACIYVDTAVAALGRACGAVLEKLGRWNGIELMVQQSGRGKVGHARHARHGAQVSS